VPLVNNLCITREESLACQKFPLAIQFFPESKLTCLTEVVNKDDLFLNHDLNLYNFVIKLNKQLKEKNIPIVGKNPLNLEMITIDQFNHIEFPNKWTNVLDLRSAIELFTPFYQLFLTSNDFVRASNSLQLDETIAIYSAQILGTPAHLGIVNNKHPMVPETTYSAAYRLVLHGLAAETLHEILVNIKLVRSNDGIVTPISK
jgi:hypothetical protein